MSKMKEYFVRLDGSPQDPLDVWIGADARDMAHDFAVSHVNRSGSSHGDELTVILKDKSDGSEQKFRCAISHSVSVKVTDAVAA